MKQKPVFCRKCGEGLRVDYLRHGYDAISGEALPVTEYLICPNRPSFNTPGTGHDLWLLVYGFLGKPRWEHGDYEE